MRDENHDHAKKSNSVDIGAAVMKHKNHNVEIFQTAHLLHGRITLFLYFALQIFMIMNEDDCWFSLEDKLMKEPQTLPNWRFSRE